MNSSADGKKIVLQYLKNLKLGSDMPYLKIIHYIPKEIYNKDTLVNLDSEINQLQSKLSNLQKEKIELETRRTRVSEDLSYIQKQANSLDEIIKKMIEVKDRENKIKQIKEQKELLTKRILDSGDQLNKKANEIEEDLVSLAKAIEDLIAKEKEHLKLALLIRDQLKKNIPQSLFDFIKIAYHIETNRDASKDNKDIVESKQQQFKNYENFKEIFSREYESLKNRVSKHLKIE